MLEAPASGVAPGNDDHLGTLFFSEVHHSVCELLFWDDGQRRRDRNPVQVPKGAEYCEQWVGGHQSIRLLRFEDRRGTFRQLDQTESRDGNWGIGWRRWQPGFLLLLAGAFCASDAQGTVSCYTPVWALQELGKYHGSREVFYPVQNQGELVLH